MESSSGSPHREMRDRERKTGNKLLKKKKQKSSEGGIWTEKRREELPNKDVTVSKKEGSAWACC